MYQFKYCRLNNKSNNRLSNHKKKRKVKQEMTKALMMKTRKVVFRNKKQVCQRNHWICWEKKKKRKELSY